MAVSIRLRREGARNRPYYKVVVADSRSPRDGKFIEIIGTYDPKKPDNNSTLKLDRIDHWISQGAQPSDTVRSLIKKNKKQSTSATPDVAVPVAATDKPNAVVEPVAPTALAEESTVAVESPASPPPLPE
jgi:small subunit ribosomal protein S16